VIGLGCDEQDRKRRVSDVVEKRRRAPGRASRPAEPAASVDAGVGARSLQSLKRLPADLPCTFLATDEGEPLQPDRISVGGDATPSSRAHW
jgi:hypothetical protein